MGNGFGEFELINLLTRHRGFRRPEVVQGVGDDTAVTIHGEKCLLFTCDAQVSGTHFLIDRVSPFALGRRVAAVNLSDIAAMGGTPLWALCSLFWDPSLSSDFYDALYDGMYAEMGRYEVQLIGGNTARSDNGLIVDLFLAGETQRDSVLYRRGAKAGDLVCVSGAIGDSAGGLAVLKSRIDAPEFEPLIQAHVNPVPRIEVGRLLARSGLVSACMDISDGLLQDACHMARASEVQIEIEDSQVPASTLLRRLAEREGKDPVELALTGGEDYELLFTVAEENFAGLQQTVLDETGVPITAIGSVKALKNGPKGARDPNELVRTASGKYRNLVSNGFDHLK